MKTDTVKTLVTLMLIAAAVIGWSAAKATYNSPIRVELSGFESVAWSGLVREGNTNVIRIGTGAHSVKQVVNYSPR
jgi:hypothetical protein